MWSSLLDMLRAHPGDGKPPSPTLTLTPVAIKFIKNIVWGLADRCTTNAGQHGGAHALLRRKMYTHADHLLYIVWWCLAHAANNEFQTVRVMLLTRHAPYMHTTEMAYY